MDDDLLRDIIWFIDRALETAANERTTDTLLDLRFALRPDPDPPQDEIDKLIADWNLEKLT